MSTVHFPTICRTSIPVPFADDLLALAQSAANERSGARLLSQAKAR